MLEALYADETNKYQASKTASSKRLEAETEEGAVSHLTNRLYAVGALVFSAGKLLQSA